jgi:tripartite-type tricarboxylate transporter receptor subunit TctC
MIPQIQAGRVRGIATTALRRDRALPDLPAVAEAVPGFQYPIWIGLMTAAATPRPIVERLHAEITRIMSAEAGQAAMRRMGAEPMVMTIPEFDAYLRNDVTTLAELVRKANLRAE